MTDFRLRTALPADRDGVVDLLQELNVFEAGIAGDRLIGRAAAEAYHAELGGRLAKGRGRLLVAEADGCLVGLLGFVIEEDDAYVVAPLRRYGAVTDLVVAEGWRRQGIGRMLLAEAERLAREAGLKRLALGVLNGNEAAERAYDAFGFRPSVRWLVKPLEEDG